MQPCHQPCNQTTAAAIRSPNAKLVDFCFGRNQLDCACRVDWKTVKAIREYLRNRSAKRRQCRQWNHQRTPLPHCQLVGKCVSRPFVTLLCRVFICLYFFFFFAFVRLSYCFERSLVSSFFSSILFFRRLAFIVEPVLRKTPSVNSRFRLSVTCVWCSYFFPIIVHIRATTTTTKTSATNFSFKSNMQFLVLQC